VRETDLACAGDVRRAPGPSQPPWDSAGILDLAQSIWAHRNIQPGRFPPQTRDVAFEMAWSGPMILGSQESLLVKNLPFEPFMYRLSPLRSAMACLCGGRGFPVRETGFACARDVGRPRVANVAGSGANMEHLRQSRPYSRHDFEVKVPKRF